MRIAIDAQELTGALPTGVGRYLAQLLSCWSHAPDASGHDFVACAPGQIRLADANGLRLSLATAPGHGTLWQQFALPRLVSSSQADVLFAPAYTAPLATRVPTVLSVHDVSFLAHPEWFGARERLRLRAGVHLSVRKATRILTFSEFSKREIVRCLHVDPGKVEVTYHGVTSLAPTPQTESGPAGCGEDALLVLYAGSLFNRRHLPEVIDGFTRLAARVPARLEIVGHNRTRPYLDIAGLAASSPAAPRVRVSSYLPDDQLASLYRRASVFVFLSEYEGFGMTPIEALGAGVPVIVLDTEVAREVYGPAALYLPRPDPDLIAAALERVLFDAGERARLLAAAPAVLGRYSWPECARRTLEALTAAAA
jgi:glycosyltransferase involved in cell wall biosynthesis